MLRQPLVAVMGHVDHGKTSLLDRIRGTAVAAKEAGGITQAIGCSIIPIATIKSICGTLLEALKQKITIPGIVFIDSPGHAAFTNLRKRGSSLSDIAILVIDINEGFKEQTFECLELLKKDKTPFIIAANKTDLIPGWDKSKKFLMEAITALQPNGMTKFENQIYEIVGKLYEHGLQGERFDRVQDYTKQVAVVPTSAVTGQGIPELLMVLTGLCHKYLEERLKTDVKGTAKGTVLEVKEHKGLGMVIDAIIYDGTLKAGDEIIVGGIEKPVVTKVKALLEPKPLEELRDKKAAFKTVKQVSAATGVRISAQGIEEVSAGMPIVAVEEGKQQQAISEVQQSVEKAEIETAPEGVVIKADSLGSLEALSFLLKQAGIPFKKAGIGPVTKKDVSDAESNLEQNPMHATILCFNIPKTTLQSKAKIITADVIYRIIEQYQEWVETEKKALQERELETLVRPCRIKLLKGYVFRQSNPAIVGVEVTAGTLKSNTPLMNPEGKHITVVKGIQLEQENIDKATKDMRVAVSLPNVIIGRQLKEGDVLMSEIPEEHFRKFKEFKEYLTEEEKEILKKIAQIMRKKNVVWGV